MEKNIKNLKKKTILAAQVRAVVDLGVGAMKKNKRKNE